MPTMQPESESLGTRRRYLRALIKVEQSEIDGGRFNGFPRKEKWQKEWLSNLRTELKELNAEILKERKSCVLATPKTA